jgi:hypothetical protein
MPIESNNLHLTSQLPNVTNLVRTNEIVQIDAPAAVAVVTPTSAEIGDGFAVGRRHSDFFAGIVQVSGVRVSDVNIQVGDDRVSLIVRPLYFLGSCRFYELALVRMTRHVA